MWVLRFLPQESFPLVVVLALVQHTSSHYHTPQQAITWILRNSFNKPSVRGHRWHPGLCYCRQLSSEHLCLFLVYRIVARSEIVKGQRANIFVT